MASGKTHFLHNLIVSGVTITYAAYNHIPLAPVILANTIAIVVTPDIDMESKTYSELLIASLLAKVTTLFMSSKKTLTRVTKIYAGIIMSITAPYAFLIPHRSWLSHLPPFSVIVQVLYFYGVYYCICKIFGFEYISLKSYYNNPELLKTQFNLVFFIVLNLQHLAHLIGDGGMVLIFGKHYYVFTKPFYNLSRKLFPQDKRD